MGRKLKHASSRLKGIRQSGRTGFWEARKVIPSELRPALGKTEFKQALNTKDEREAIRGGAPILADWQDQIDVAKGRIALAVAPIQRHQIDRNRAYDAIQRWKSSQLKSALNDAFNGSLDPAPLSFGDEMREHVQMVGELREGQWSAIANFDAKLSDALNSQGIMCDPAHPAIPNIRPWFADALASVEHGIMEYRKGNLADAPEAPSVPFQAVVRPEASETRPTASKPGTKLMDLFASFQANSPKTVLARHKGYVTRLNEYLGDPDIATIKPLDMLAFRAELERFPKEKRDVSKVPFLTVIANAEKTDPKYERLAQMTVWNWTQTYKQMFKFAVRNDLLTKNPAEHMMPKPSRELSQQREIFDAEDIKGIFSTPLFQGASGKLHAG